MLRYLVYLFQETVLGITSLSALGSIGAVLEIILILYPFLLANNQQLSVTCMGQCLNIIQGPVVQN